MAGASDAAAGLVQRLQDIPQRLSDSIRASALWLAVLDGPLDAREFHEVGLALTHEPEGVPLQDIAAAFAAEPMPKDLPKLFRFLRGQRSAQRTVWLLDLYIRVAAADGRISQLERHALIFLSDLLAAPAALLQERFDAVLGIDFEPPADLSDPAFYEAAEAATKARQARTAAREADAAKAGAAAAERRDALLVLGVRQDATPIAIKAAWRKLSRQHHPDRQPQGDAAALAEAAARFDAVQKAWKRLQEDDDA
jgi:pyruvate/2-oxoglutarate dehydrogenase complex dihydrolipoamide acyltransferase (E2) component